MNFRTITAATILLAMVAMLSPLAANAASASPYDGTDDDNTIIVWGDEPVDDPVPTGPTASYNYCLTIAKQMLATALQFQENVAWLLDGPAGWLFSDAVAQATMGVGPFLPTVENLVKYNSSNCDQHRGLGPVPYSVLPMI